MSVDLFEADARDFREELIELFRAGGNDELERLFDWYYADNGSRPARTWILRGGVEGAVVGSYSVVFRDFVYRGTEVQVGVAGNLMVHPDHRSGFAALNLVRAVRSVVDEGECDVLLGLPMERARQVLARMGFESIGPLVTYTQVFDATAPLRRRFGPWGAAAAPVVNLASRLRRITRPLPKTVSVAELEAPELDIPELRRWTPPEDVVAPRPNPGLVKWRLAHPGQPTRAFALRLEGKVQGVVCVATGGDTRAQVVLAVTDASRLSEGAAVRALARFLQGSYSSVSASPPGSSTLARELEGSGFVRRARGRDTADELLGYWRADHPLAEVFSTPGRWAFLPGLNDV